MPFQFNLINDFKGFPDEHKPNHDIELDRSYDYLQWRYIENPHSYEIYKINLKNDYIGYAIFRKAKYQDFKSLFLSDIYVKKKYSNYTRSVVSKIILSSYKLNEYAFFASCFSKLSIYRNALTVCFPIKFSKIPFIVYKNLAPESFMEVKGKSIHFVLGDGDNI